MKVFKLSILIFLEILLLGLFALFLFKREKNIIEEELQTRLHSSSRALAFLFQKQNQLNKLDLEFIDKLSKDLLVENLYVVQVQAEEKSSFYVIGTNLEKELRKNSQKIELEYLNLEKNEALSKVNFFKRNLEDKQYFSYLNKQERDEQKFFFGVDINSKDYENKLQFLQVLYLGIFVLFCITFIYFTYYFFKYKSHVFKNRLLLYLSLVFAMVSSFFTSYFLFQYYESKVYAKFDSKLYISAMTLNYVLPHDYHDRLDEFGESKFLELKPLLNRFVEFLEIYYAYTVIYENGKFLYSSTNETEEDIQNGLETKFLDEAESDFLSYVETSYTENKIVIYNDIGTKWGDYRSIFIPRKNIQKKDYLIAIDIKLQNIQDLLKGFYILILFEAFLSFAFYFVLYIAFIFPTASYAYAAYKNSQKGLSVKYKLAILMSILFTFSMTIVSWIFLYNSRKILKEQTLNEVRLISENISSFVKEDLLMDSSYETTNSFLMNLSRTEGIGLLDLYVINMYGKYVVDTGKSRIGEYASSSEISYIQSINELDAKEEYSVRFKKEILRITLPIFIELENQNIKIGAAIFEYDRELIYKPIYKLQVIILVSSFFLLIIAVLITVLLSRYLMNPIVHLTKGVQIISSGNLNYKIAVTTKDEIGVLSEKFNEMTRNLKKSYDELEDKVRERTADLQKSQQTLLTVLSNSPLALFSIDTNGKILLAEGKNLLSLGFTSEALVGISIFEIFSETPEVVNKIKDTIQKQEQSIIQIQLENLFFEVNSSPLWNTENQMIGAVILLFDITENIKAKELVEKEKEKSDKLLLNILPDIVAKELKENGFVKPTLYESVTVLFTDFKGFTKIASKLTPNELIEKLDLIFLQFDQICERRGIEKLKTIGDAYMCVGGLPIPNLSHPVDVCLAAIEMQNFMKETKLIMESISGEEFWDMRLGIHTGTVVAGVIGKTKFAYDVWGDAVNTASRMESNGEIGQINISDSTYEQVKDFFICEHRGKIEAKNKGLVDMYFLVRIRPELSKDKRGYIPNQEFFELYKERFFGTKLVN